LSKLRRTEVFGMTMTELVLTLLFVLLFAVLPRNSGDAGSNQDSIEELKKIITKQEIELVSLRNEVKDKESEIKELQSTLFSVLQKLNMPLPLDSPTIDIKNTIKDILPKISPIKSVGKQGGGTGKANCLGSGNYLLAVTMQDDRYTIRKLWKEKDNPVAEQISVIKEWNKEGKVSVGRFKSDGNEVRKWSDSNDCRFSVKVYDQTTTKQAFISQLDNIEAVFYLTRIKGRQ